MLTERACAKVNLFLHVTGRRPDGYHLLDSLAVFADAADGLSAGPGDGLSLRITGPWGASLAAEPDNLVLRAARALAEAGGVAPRAALVLEKHLPVASGIGGGSADAAAALRLLSRAWGLGAGPEELRRVAAGLGADVPVCVGSRPAVMRGVGEQLRPAPVLPPCGIVLVNPGVAVPTQAVFRARQGGFSAEAVLPDSWPDLPAMLASLGPTRNDLQYAAIGLCPVIADVLAWLRQAGCLLCRMSGSGATCFALCPTPAAAARVAATVPLGWWSWGGGFTDGPPTA